MLILRAAQSRDDARLCAALGHAPLGRAFVGDLAKLALQRGQQRLDLRPRVPECGVALGLARGRVDLRLL